MEPVSSLPEQRNTWIASVKRKGEESMVLCLVEAWFPTYSREIGGLVIGILCCAFYLWRNRVALRKPDLSVKEIDKRFDHIRWMYISMWMMALAIIIFFVYCP